VKLTIPELDWILERWDLELEMEDKMHDEMDTPKY
jgi:hypothetical protein